MLVSEPILVRSTLLKGFAELVKEQGGDAHALLTEVGIRDQSLSDSDFFFPYVDFAKLLKVSARELMMPDIGLKFAFGQNSEVLGPVAYLVIQSATVRKGVEDVARYLYHVSPAIKLSIFGEGERQEVCIDLVGVGIPEPAQAIEHNISATFNIIGELIGGPTSAKRVQFRHEQISPTRIYEQHFRCPLEFEAPRNSIQFERKLLDNPLPAANQGLRKILDEYLANLAPAQGLTSPAVSIVDQVYRLTEKLLPSGRVCRATIAQKLAVHERSLQRRLQAEGESFESILDRVRQDKVQKLLRHQDLPMSQVAGQLGYSEQSSFNRAFKRWFELTPRQYMQRQGLSGAEN